MSGWLLEVVVNAEDRDEYTLRWNCANEEQCAHIIQGFHAGLPSGTPYCYNMYQVFSDEEDRALMASMSVTPLGVNE